MPQTRSKNSHELSIRLDRPDSTYLPGETITGRVTRNAHIVATSATVTVSLHARSKSRMVARRGHLTSTYRGRFDLVQPTECSKTIFQGPLHIAEGDAGDSWPFSINLPASVEGAVLQLLAGADQTIFTQGADIADLPLPPTFLIERYDYMSGMSAFVEYYLQAELQTSSRGSSTVEAILPFKMLYINPEPLSNPIVLHTSRHTIAIQGNSPIAASVEVQIPTILQIEGPEPITVRVLAVPSRPTEDEKERLGLPEIEINRIYMNIIAKTEVKCPKGKNVHETDCQAQINLHAEDAFGHYGSSLYIPWKVSSSERQQTQSNVSGSEISSSEAANIGSQLGLRLQRSQDLYPSFQTLNIRHNHRLQWEITVEAGGQNFELSGEEPIKILSRPEAERSTQWIQPPPEDQLPGFSDDEDVDRAGSRRSSRTNDPAAGVSGLSRLWVF
ncbi:hypothetical protein FBEOM_5824 [Fusarium beomiforme]|uniref:Arrestin-like N-terminal domain-containing protein n=1 Tax=Fusarium beomiforme TaxID=44412 RepID=A0A9P5AKV1_9HYPO|nr:hypothetical protein FBEOM_5824 [Fusarium beomiforme]